MTVSPTRIVSADGAKLNPLISIEWNDDDIGTDVVGATTTGSDVVVDSGADVVVTTAVGLDVVVDAAMVVVVVGVAVDVVVATVEVVSGAVEVVEAAVELVSATDDVVVTTTVDVVSTAVEEAAVGASVGVVVSGAAAAELSVVETTSLLAVLSVTDPPLSSVNDEDSAPCGCCGWHAEKVTTQASEVIATVRDSVFGMQNVRTWRRDRPLRLHAELIVTRVCCISSDPGSSRIRLQADALSRTRRNTPCLPRSPAQSPN